MKNLKTKLANIFRRLFLHISKQKQVDISNIIEK